MNETDRPTDQVVRKVRRISADVSDRRRTSSPTRVHSSGISEVACEPEPRCWPVEPLGATLLRCRGAALVSRGLMSPPILDP